MLQRARGGWKLYALEGLSRGPRDTNVRAADVLFEYVRRLHVEDVVDRECISRVLQAAKELPGAPRITVNAHASTLGRDPGFLPFFEKVLRETGIPPTRVVVEIVEKSPVWDDNQLRQVLEGLRSLGSSIALDDVGLGQSNMKMILECQPDYFKVDRYLVAGSSADFYRRALLKSLSDLAGSVGAHVIAEGIEDYEEPLDHPVGGHHPGPGVPPGPADEPRRSHHLRSALGRGDRIGRARAHRAGGPGGLSAEVGRQPSEEWARSLTADG